MASSKQHILLMGQTPPPWHGQAVATQILFDHDWPEFEVHRLRMEFSEEMLEVGRFQWRKIWRLIQLIWKAKAILKANPNCILFYPPASAKWVPFLRDVIFLASLRHLAGATVFIFHASGLPAFVNRGILQRFLGRLAYQHVDFSLEVAQETLTAHDQFQAKNWQWCPCAIEVKTIHSLPCQSKDPLSALFVGSLQEGKGVTEILKTARLLKEQGRENDFRFRVVGKWFSHEFENEIRHLITEWQLERMVELTGQLTGDDKWQAYAQADLFFFPTHYASEASPIVLMEALGMGLPILSTQWAGIPAMLKGCTTAWLLPIQAPDQYATTLLELFARKGEFVEIQRASREFYRENFLPQRFIDRVSNAFSVVSETITPSSQNKASLPQTGESQTLAKRPKITVTTYLADQNPGYDRSFGISRMTQIILESLKNREELDIEVITSRTSKQAPTGMASRRLPWGTRKKWIRLLTDHFHPLFMKYPSTTDVFYFPKGYLPLLNRFCHPAVVTIHDTIIQYDEDHYPKWRKPKEYRYWAIMLKHTLQNSDCILTVSQSSRQQIEGFMDRHQIPRKPITVTYEPCLYETIEQPKAPEKENYVIHLASCEPHKRTAHLIRWWHEAESLGHKLPMLHLIGTVPHEVAHLLADSHSIVKRPFLEESALQSAYRSAKALILPSEIEGFGLPALEAYYLGTPVCYVKGTSVEEVLSVATDQGAFSLDRFDSLFEALDQVFNMSDEEIYRCGMKLREVYATHKVAQRMINAFQEIVSPS